MVLGSIWRGNWGVQKTGLNRSQPVHRDRSFAVFYLKIWKDRTCSLLKDRSWSGFFPVFFQSWDRTSKHYGHGKECDGGKSYGLAIVEEFLTASSQFSKKLKWKKGNGDSVWPETSFALAEVSISQKSFFLVSATKHCLVAAPLRFLMGRAGRCRQLPHLSAPWELDIWNQRMQFHYDPVRFYAIMFAYQGH